MPNFQLSTKPKKSEADDILVVACTNKNTFLYDQAERTIFIDIKKLKITSNDKNHIIFLGNTQEKEIYAVEKSNFYQKDFASVHAFKFLDDIDQREKQIFYRGFQLINWNKHSPCCSCCDGKTHMDDKEFVKICGACDQKIFPQYSPDHSSQPWPFPNSQMVGFTAEHESGDSKVDKKEVGDANWFRIDELPTLPIRSSIAYNLIDDFVKNNNRNTSFYFGFFHKLCAYFAASFFTGSLLSFIPFLKNGKGRLPFGMYNRGVYFSSILFGHRIVRDKLSNYVNNLVALPMTSCLATSGTYFSLLFPISALKIYDSNKSQNILSVFRSTFRHTFFRAPAVGLAGEAVFQLYESIYKNSRSI